MAGILIGGVGVVNAIPSGGNFYFCWFWNPVMSILYKNARNVRFVLFRKNSNGLCHIAMDRTLSDISCLARQHSTTCRYNYRSNQDHFFLQYMKLRIVDILGPQQKLLTKNYTCFSIYEMLVKGTKPDKRFVFYLVSKLQSNFEPFHTRCIHVNATKASWVFSEFIEFSKQRQNPKVVC